MRKIILAALIIFAMTVVQANAFSISYDGPVKMKLTGYTTSVGDGTIASWAIVRIVDIETIGGDPLWQQSSNDYVLGAIWGLTDLSYEGTGPYSIDMSNGQFALYSGTGTANTDWNNLVTNPIAYNYPGITTANVGSLFTGDSLILSGTFAADVQGGTTGTTLIVTSSALTTPATGGGNGYANLMTVTGVGTGSDNAQFNSNAYLGGTDLRLQYNFSIIQAGQGDPGVGLWGASMEDPVNLTAIPEPATLLLLGMGLIGLGLARRKSRT
jgi:hypothetical protein